MTPKKAVSCPNPLLIRQSDSPWLGMTDNYEREQANKRIQAVHLQAHKPFATLAHFDQPDILLGKNASGRIVSINQHYFSDLRRGDATRLSPGSEHSIGVFRDTSFTRLSPRKLVLFLLQAQIVETYWHLEAELCPGREEDTPESYRAEFRGIHRYCTNQCEEQGLAFSLYINKIDGGITLIGNKP